MQTNKKQCTNLKLMRECKQHPECSWVPGNSIKGTKGYCEIKSHTQVHSKDCTVLKLKKECNPPCVWIPGSKDIKGKCTNPSTPMQTQNTHANSNLNKEILKLEANMELLHKKTLDAMAKKDMKGWHHAMMERQQVQQKLQAARKKKQEINSSSIPAFLKKYIDPETGRLPDVPTVNGDVPMDKLIKTEKQLMDVDGYAYDIKSLFDLIQADIPQGNVWGTDPYARRLGFARPFEKNVKENVLQEGIKRGILSSNTRWTDHTPEKADDKEMRGTYRITVKNTPQHWMTKGWASNGSAFPTSQYYAVSFSFPYAKHSVNPGNTVIFPFTPAAKEFIDKKLIPVYKAGALWSKSRSVTMGKEVINPNVHLIFEDNQPQRWYAKKLHELELEIQKFAPAFSH